MTREDKQLLLQDLCARLPYGVKFRTLGGGFPFTLKWIDDCNRLNGEVRLENAEIFLRPMSSMTEEEKVEYRKVCELDTEILANHPMNGEPFPALYNSQDWLNKNMFDYRGLIPKGLANEAPEGMYKMNKI